MAQEQLREADRRKDEFLAVLAHELRNPLAPIRTAVELLKLLGPPQPRLQQVREMIERQVNHMVRLVDDLLDVSRISRGKIKLQRERVQLTEIISSAVEACGPLIEADHHRLTVSAAAEPLVVEGDALRLTQVVSNLLNNAAKFTPEGGEISVTVGRQGQQAVIGVRDTGLGVPADMLERIFEMFTQIERDLKGAQGGLGIGLTLVRRLVEMHGGTVQAQSEGEGKGTEFVVRLPLAELRDEHRNDPAEPGTAGEPSRRRILVVDDNVDAAQSIAMLLSLLGHEAQTAHDGASGIEQAASFQPQLILLDLGMPGMDGFETAGRVRQLPGGKDIVIAALTGWGQEEDRRRTKEAGFNFHLVKPVAPEALREVLASLVQ